MRTSTKKTNAFFKEHNVEFVENTLIIADRELHYVQTGKPNGPTLVFVHGSPGSWDAYKRYLTDERFLDRFRMIAVDRPGFGFSDFRKSASLGEQSQLLNALMDSLKNDKPQTLIGHSYGGPLIVKMALDRPDLHDNLVILAGALDPEAEKPEKWRKPLTWIPLKYLVPGALKPSNDEIWMLKEDLKTLKPHLGELTQRVLLIHGTSDKLVPYKNVAFMQKTFTNVAELKTITLENERHFIVWDRERLIKDNLWEWTQSVKPVDQN